MNLAQLGIILQRLGEVAPPSAATDADLLARYARGEQAAFAELVTRYSGLVWSVGRRILHRQQDGEDVFQAAFLALSRKANLLRGKLSLAPWLYTVAVRLALNVKRGRKQKRYLMEMAEPATLADPSMEASGRELAQTFDEEMERLPAKYREAVVLCCLEGLSRDEAAAAAQCTLGVMKNRLERGRKLLRKRLERRGIAVPATLLLVGLTNRSAPAAACAAACRVTEMASPAVAALAGKAIAGSIMMKTIIITVAMGLMAVGIGIGGGLLADTEPIPKAPPAAEIAQAKQPDNETKPPKDEAAEKAKPRLDRFGDPLPEGALARLGTLRLGHGGTICSVAFSGDNKLLATAGFDGFVNVWDASTGQRQLQLNGTSPSMPFNSGRVALSPDGSCLAIAWVNSPPGLWDVRTGKKLRDIGDSFCRASRVQFSENGKYLTISPCAEGVKDQFSMVEAEMAVLAEVDTGKVIFNSAGKILLLPGKFIHLDPNRPEVSLHKIGENEVSIQFKGHEVSVTAAALVPDGKKLFTHGSDRTIRVWDTTTGKELHRLDNTPEIACQLIPAPDAKSVLTLVTQGSSMQCWDIESGKVRWTAKVDANGNGFNHASFLPGGNTVVTGHNGGRLRQWDVKTGKEQKVVRTNFEGTITCMALSPDGKTLATTSNCNDNDTIVHLFDAATLTPKAAQQRHTQLIVASAFSPDGRIIATSGIDRSVRLWEPRTGKPIWTINTPTNACRSLLFTPDGKTLVTGNGYSAEGEVRFWDVETGKTIRKFKSDPKGPILLALSADGKQIFTIGSDERIRCWDANTFKQLGEFGDEKPSRVLRLALSPDGSTLATTHMDQVLRVWDARTFKKLYQLVGGLTSHIGAIAFSPDNSLLAWTDDVAGIRLTDVTSGNEVRRIISRANSFDGIAFAPNGKTLVWGITRSLPTNPNAVRVWEIRTGELRRTLDGHNGPAEPLAFSPDGSLLVTAGSDGSALIWDVRRRVTGERTAAPPTPEKLAACWDGLADADAAKAFACMEIFRQSPAQGVPVIAGRLQPMPRVAAEKIAKLLEELDSDAFKVREAAMRELQRLGESVFAELRVAAMNSGSAGTRDQAERLLKRIEEGRLQRERAVEVLEMIGDDAAKKLLKSLASGDPNAPLTRDAKGAVRRLE